MAGRFVKLLTSYRSFGTTDTPLKSQSTLRKLGLVAVGTVPIGGAIYYATRDDIEKRRLRVVVGGIRRFFRSLRIGVKVTADYWWSLRNLDEKAENYETLLSAVHQRSADSILYGCLRNGGLYIKLGQGLVSLNHILPKEYLRTLKKLQDQCLTRRKDEVHDVFKEEFGESYESMFESFDPVPIAAASLAQVFKAETKKGEEVAVKVQYIDLQDRYLGDVSTINLLLWISAMVLPKFDFRWVLAELSETLSQELDFVNEGKNAERCASDLSHFKFLHVPKVHWDLTSKRILTTEFIHGTKINDARALEAQGFSLADIDTKLFKAFSEQIFRTGFVHADPHPGNVLVRARKDKSPEIVLLDHGLYQYVPTHERQSLCSLWKSIVLHDYDAMQSHSEALGVKDSFLLAEILMQRPLKLHNYRLKLSLSEDDMKYMTEMARQRFDKIIVVLREMPKNLLLVIRNINTIRAIAKDHGDPVDRYWLMARCATQGAFFEKNAGVIKRMKGLQQRTLFEIRLYTDSLLLWFWRTVYRLLVAMGRAPDLTSIVRDINHSL